MEKRFTAGVVLIGIALLSLVFNVALFVKTTKNILIENTPSIDIVPILTISTIISLAAIVLILIGISLIEDMW